MQSTLDLAQTVRSSVSARFAVKTLARVFQALRIEVNKEFDELHKVLKALPKVLRQGGRAVILSYHSLEDRTVKDFLRAHSLTREPDVSKYLPEKPLEPDLRILTRKPVKASESEIREYLAGNLCRCGAYPDILAAVRSLV